MSDSNTRFVIGAGLFTIVMVGSVIYLFSAYLSHSLPFQQYGPDSRTADVQNKSVARTQGASDKQKSTSVSDQRSPVATPAPVNENSNTQITRSVVEEPSALPEHVTDRKMASLTDNTITIKAFKASMFSDLTENATEVPLDQGDQVKVLERNGSWVKVEVIEGGAIGFVHSSYFGDFYGLTKPAHSNGVSGQKSYRIMALGDSITQGVSGEKSYRNTLVQLLDNSLCEYEMVGSRTENRVATDFSSPHEAYASHPVDYFLNGVNGNPGIDKTIPSYRPNVLLVHLGSVDMFVDESVESTIQELDALTTKIWNTGTDIEIYMANAIPWYGISKSNDNIGEDSAALTSAIGKWVEAKVDPRLHLVDVNSDYVEAFMLPDGIHPNADGDAFLAQTFLASLRANGVCPETTAPPIVE